MWILILIKFMLSSKLSLEIQRGFKDIVFDLETYHNDRFLNYFKSIVASEINTELPIYKHSPSEPALSGPAS